MRAISISNEDLKRVAGKIGGRDLSAFTEFYTAHNAEPVTSAPLVDQTESTRKAILAYQENPARLCSERGLASQNYSQPSDSFFVRHSISAHEMELEKANGCKNPGPVSKLSASYNAILANYIKAENDKNCQHVTALKPMHPVLGWYTPSTSSKVSDVIVRRLAQKNPVLIAYDSSFLQEGIGAPVEQPDHEGVISAARWSGKSCEFKLRNTWGETCRPYEMAGLEESCDKGNIWISEDTLNARTYSTVYIRKNQGLLW